MTRNGDGEGVESPITFIRKERTMSSTISRSNKNLDRFFNPESVALIGASKSFAKTGTQILFSILAGGFKGQIYPINQKETEIMGLKAYSSLKETPTIADLAIICVQAGVVPQVIRECGEAGISFGIVISSGFGEVSRQGKNLEEEILKAAHKGRVRIIGPNCMGLVSSGANLHALMNMLIPMDGSAAVISQSGTIGSLTSIYGSEQGIGFSKFISTGNEADLHTEDFIEYLASDPQTKVLSAFIEGIKDGKRFLQVAKEAVKKKPLIVLKGGITEAGAKAATSHTGSIAGSRAVFEAMVKQTGVIQAMDEKEMVDLIKAFSLLPLPKGRRVGITGAWGGLAVLASDACMKSGLTLARLSEESMEELNRILPPFWSHGNPVDVTGAGLGGDFAILTEPIDILLRDDSVDAVIWMVPALGSLFKNVTPRMEPHIAEHFSKTALGSMTDQEMGMAKHIVELYKKYNKPLVAILIGLYGRGGAEHIRFLEDNGVPVYESTQQAAMVLSKLIDYKEYISA